MKLKSDKKTLRRCKEINKKYKRYLFKNALTNKSPIKNYVWCGGCGRKKHLYKSEKAACKALEFTDLTFSEGKKKPIRCFYCKYCLGWHLTSQEYRPKYEETT